MWKGPLAGHGVRGLDKSLPRTSILQYLHIIIEMIEAQIVSSYIVLRREPGTFTGYEDGVEDQPGGMFFWL